MAVLTRTHATDATVGRDELPLFPDTVSRLHADAVMRWLGMTISGSSASGKSAALSAWFGAYFAVSLKLNPLVGGMLAGAVGEISSNRSPSTVTGLMDFRRDAVVNPANVSNMIDVGVIEGELTDSKNYNDMANYRSLDRFTDTASVQSWLSGWLIGESNAMSDDEMHLADVAAVTDWVSYFEHEVGTPELDMLVEIEVEFPPKSRRQVMGKVGERRRATFQTAFADDLKPNHNK